MATILLSAAGAAIGSGFGGSILGLSGAVLGRAAGAAFGRSLDQRVLGSGSAAVESGKVDRFRLSGVGYGTPIQEVWGRMRVAGEIIWASRFQERRQQSGGGKGAPRTSSTSFSYSVSLAIALCRGEALRVGRIWADGVEISPNSIDLRFYPGSESQLPDSKIEAVEGVGFAPAYRGMCYVVIENLMLARFGNRVPQFSFEVVRRANVEPSDEPRDLVDAIKAVSLIPGSGEYALATTPVHFNYGLGQNVSTNVHSMLGETDFSASLKQLNEELPNCKSVSLVVSWFGSDLRCGYCEIQPKVEQQTKDGVEMPWEVSGTSRLSAAVVPTDSGRSVYGGTPSDRSVMEAIQAIRATGKEVMFYPFILMDQLAGNTLPDPWSEATTQPALPWRGRISLSRAPGRSGTPDQTSAAASELASFIGSADATDFSPNEFGVTFAGTQEWSFRRFILHYAHLCALAGGVDAFCIGSELRGLTQIRSSSTEFPMVQALISLASEVRSILGSQTKISYAADWSEYFGLHVGGDVLFHLDPLWAHPVIDFVGIDNYMPISDWRDVDDNKDKTWETIYNIDYLVANVAGGEGYDWYYDSLESEANQVRTVINDIAHGENWVFRSKDIKGWWSNTHHERVSGVRQTSPTGWIPGMKPIRFTEYGCAALNKATNQPNKFIDSKSSESSIPRGSNGLRDDYLQIQYYLAMGKFWSQRSNNPESNLYSGHMVDFDRSHAWAWDARPYPDFPGNLANWSDGVNYAKGHWLNGRSSNQQIALVVSEICGDSGIAANLDLSGLHGSLRGFTAEEAMTARSKLQTLSLIFGFDVIEKTGSLTIANREFSSKIDLEEKSLVPLTQTQAHLEYTRGSESEYVDRIRLLYVEADNDFEARASESTFPDDSAFTVLEAETPVQLTSREANAIVERWLVETRLSIEKIRFAIPKSHIQIDCGDLVHIAGQTYRIDHIDDSDAFTCSAVKADLGAYIGGPDRGEIVTRTSTSSPMPVFAVFLDLPLFIGDEIPHAPHVAIASTPWPGHVSVWNSPTDSSYSLNIETESPAIIGLTETVLSSAPVGLWDNGSSLRIVMSPGEIGSASQFDVLNGANLAAIGDGSNENWEIIQFADANLVGENTYELRRLLRGLVGTDAVVPTDWPPGSFVIILDGFVPQINLASAARGLERYYRIGASSSGYTDGNVLTRIEKFNGIGLRPYSVAHLGYEWDATENLNLSWIRRTRFDGDSWISVEVPLGEESESYTVSITKGSVSVRTTIVESSSWTYSRSMQTEDEVVAPFEVSVAQNSETFGPGPFKSVSVL
jgi:GTA TIM-barrel-like domain/Putative phage tail protein